MKPFTPRPAATVNIDVSASSQRVQIQDSGKTTAVRIMNDGTATAWVNFGDSSVTAAVASGMPVPSGAIEVVQVNVNAGSPLNVAAIAAGSTGKIHFTPGEGV